jgi:hypothetical protein
MRDQGHDSDSTAVIKPIEQAAGVIVCRVGERLQPAGVTPGRPRHVAAVFWLFHLPKAGVSFRVPREP